MMCTSGLKMKRLKFSYYDLDQVQNHSMSLRVVNTVAYVRGASFWLLLILHHVHSWTPAPSRAPMLLLPVLWLPNFTKRRDLPGGTPSTCPRSPSRPRSELHLWREQQSGSRWTSPSSLFLWGTLSWTATSQRQARGWMKFMRKTQHKYSAWPAVSPPPTLGSSCRVSLATEPFDAPKHILDAYSILLFVHIIGHICKVVHFWLLPFSFFFFSKQHELKYRHYWPLDTFLCWTKSRLISHFCASSQAWGFVFWGIKLFFI